jgi:hypothetical protein
MKRDIKRTRTVYECELKIYKKNRNSLAKWCLIKAEITNNIQQQHSSICYWKIYNNAVEFLYYL